MQTSTKCYFNQAALALFFCVAAIPTTAQTITDGDTLKLNGTTYRLWRIDAPETKQTCADGWPAGIEATAVLRVLMRDRTTACEAKTTDRYGRTIAICRANGRDLGADMVSAGMAWAFVRYSRDYAGQEAKAKTAAHGCMPAWEWRARNRAGK